MYLRGKREDQRIFIGLERNSRTCKHTSHNPIFVPLSAETEAVPDSLVSCIGTGNSFESTEGGEEAKVSILGVTTAGVSPIEVWSEGSETITVRAATFNA